MKILALDLGKFKSVCCLFDSSTRKNHLAVSLGHKTLVRPTNEEAWRWSNVKRKTHKDDALNLARLAVRPIVMS